MRFIGKNPQNKREWSEEHQSIQVFLGVFSELVRENVRNGVLMALNDAFGGKN
jgi:hypothetical protein